MQQPKLPIKLSYLLLRAVLDTLRSPLAFAIFSAWGYWAGYPEIAVMWGFIALLALINLRIENATKNTTENH